MKKKEKKSFKSGFVVLVGRSNVGKSTLLNSLVGTKVAITTPKPQTTRMAIQGIVHDERGQIVFIDTPGVFSLSHNVLSTKMTQIAKSSTKDMDLIVYVVDPTREIGNEEHIILRLIKGLKIPKILVINKIDLPELPFIDYYRDWQSDFNEIIEISAYHRKNLKPLIDLIFKYLPEGEAYFPQYQFTSMDYKTWVEELIREKVFLLTGEEIPYHVKVEAEEIEQRDNGVLFIKANLITSQKKHRKMLIGQGGQKIKQIGTLARKELEQVMNKKIYLELEVKEESHWEERFGF